MRRISIFLFVLIQNFIYGQGYVCAIGGGSENYSSWSDAPYRWIVQKSDSGKIIVLSVNDEDQWIPNYFKSFGAIDAVNKKINSRTLADQQSTYEDIITAKAIFIKGGDQWNYINYWKGTKTEQAILYVFNNGGVIAGTSAGAMVLGAVDYSAQYSSITSKDCLLNPFSNNVSLENNFLNLVPNVIFDSHVAERGRFARSIAFITKYHFNNSIDILAAAIDDKTAICIDTNGVGTVMGSGAVAIFQADNKTRWEKLNTTYTVANLKCDQLTANWQYNFRTKNISYIPPTAKTVDTLRAIQLPLTDFWFTGINSIQSNINISLTSFLNSANTSNILIIHNPGYTSNVSTLTNYLTTQSINYATLALYTSTLNDNSNLNKINNATSFIFLGDSLNVLSLLKDTSTVVGNGFRNKLSSSNPMIYFMGNAGKTSGEFYIDNMDSYANASYSGYMTNNKGNNLFGDLIFQPLVFDNADYYQNRVTATLWGLMLNRKRIGIYLDNNDYLFVNKNKKTITSFGPLPIVVIDARKTTKVDSSVFIAQAGYKTRQCVAMNELRYSVSNIDKNYSYDSFNIVSSVNEEKKENQIIKSFQLYQNFPNPFNPATTIKYKIEKKSFTSLKVFNVLGNEITTLVNEERNPGEYQVEFSPSMFGISSLPSGVYYYQLISSSNSQTLKMIYLK